MSQLFEFFPHYINSPSFSVGKLKTTTIKQFEIYCPTKVRQPGLKNLSE